MTTETRNALKKWAKTLPYAKPERPSSFGNQLKYYFWRVYTPYHPLVRNTLNTLRRVSLEKRQDFLIGKVAPHLTIRSFVDALVDRGFGNHFIAWRDAGEVVSLRYLVGFAYQYHIRVFEDREVRAHFEYTPECYPLRHFLAVGQEERREDFLKIFGDTIVVNQD